MAFASSLPAVAASPHRQARPPAEYTSRIFQAAVLLYIFVTGALPDILQATFFGVAAGGLAAATAIVLELVQNILLAAPLLVLARHPAGVLHPIIVAVVIWPLLTQLPNTIDSFAGYGGFVDGEPLRPPNFLALASHDSVEAWWDLVRYRGIETLALLSIYVGFAFVTSGRQRKLAAFSAIETRRLRRVLVGIILVNLVAVGFFIEFRGGLIDHIAQLSFGRFRALAGLGPLIALFDSGFICLLIWICYRPQDARSGLFVVLLPVVAAQQFIVAGSRSAMLMVFVLVGLGWMMRTGRIPWRLALLLLPIAFASFGALNIVRTAGLSNSTAVEAAQDADLADVVERSRTEFEQRQALAGSVPVTVDGMRTTGPMLGATYAGALFAAVPRTIWEDKPRGPGSMYAQIFLGEAREGMAVPVSPAAEAFWNFHVPGVIFLFALYGMLLQIGFRIYSANRENGVVIAAFVLFITHFGVGTEQLVAFQQAALTFAVVMLMLLPFRAGLRANDEARAAHPAAHS